MFGVEGTRIFEWTSSEFLVSTHHIYHGCCCCSRCFSVTTLSLTLWVRPLFIFALSTWTEIMTVIFSLLRGSVAAWQMRGRLLCWCWDITTRISIAFNWLFSYYKRRRTVWKGGRTNKIRERFVDSPKSKSFSTQKIFAIQSVKCISVSLTAAKVCHSVTPS